MFTLVAFESVTLALVVGVHYQSWLAGLGTFLCIWLLAVVRSWLSVVYGLVATAAWGLLGFQLLDEFGIGWAIAGALAAAVASFYAHALWFQRVLPDADRMQAAEGPPSDASESSSTSADVDPELCSSPDPYVVLDLQPGATDDEIRRAYKEQVRQYHPDRVEALGADLRQLADQRTKEINWAYDTLLRRRS